jgi:hypothetical protein
LGEYLGGEANKYYDKTISVTVFFGSGLTKLGRRKVDMVANFEGV